MYLTSGDRTSASRVASSNVPQDAKHHNLYETAKLEPTTTSGDRFAPVIFKHRTHANATVERGLALMIIESHDVSAIFRAFIFPDNMDRTRRRRHFEFRVKNDERGNRNLYPNDNRKASGHAEVQKISTSSQAVRLTSPCMVYTHFG